MARTVQQARRATRPRRSARLAASSQALSRRPQPYFCSPRPGRSVVLGDQPCPAEESSSNGEEKTIPRAEYNQAPPRSDSSDSSNPDPVNVRERQLMEAIELAEEQVRLAEARVEYRLRVRSEAYMRLTLFRFRRATALAKAEQKARFRALGELERKLSDSSALP